MKNKKIPMRTCIVTKECLEKKDLIRVVRTPDKKVIVDLTGKVNGRGAYLKKDIAVIEKCAKSKILDNVLGIEVPIDIFTELKSIINKN